MSNACENNRGASARGNSSPWLKPGGSLPRFAEDGSAVDSTESPEKEQTDTAVVSQNRCPRHPNMRWIRFDPAGQAWCDKMECWDCYRLMKIGEALGYRELSGCTSTIGQGMAAWSFFVTSQGSFAIVTTTQQAIALCEASGIEVPDLSGEVQHLVSAW